jgi:hypothetical protein
MLRPLTFVLLLLSLHGSSAFAQTLSGENSQIMIAVDPQTKIITGYYTDSTGYDDPSQGVKFTCIFYLRGKAEGEQPYKITTWFPGDSNDHQLIRGQIRFDTKGTKRVVVIRLEEEHGGCWNVMHFADDEDAELTLERSGTWSSIRIVSARRAHFYSSPTAASKLRTYLTTGDSLKVFSAESGRVNAEYITQVNFPGLYESIT